MMNECFKSLLAGVPIFADPCVPFLKETHRQERKWAHRKMYKRYQRFKIKQEPTVITFEGRMYANPKTVDLIKAVCQ